MTDSLAVVIPAAGRARRFGRDKLFENLAGQTVISRALAPFLHRSDVTRIIIATDQPDTFRTVFSDPRIVFQPGGESRAHSVRSALLAVPNDVEWIAVHDAARPLVDDALIDRTLSAAKRHGAAVPALSVHLTIKQAAGPLPAKVRQTLDRTQLFAMQTPQIMRRCDLVRAFDQCPIPLDQVTDDAQLLELIGLPVWLVEGDPRNIKITTPMDLRLAELMLCDRI
jgi:2-C-methyl-D-erythritol 4-phosphate cytidylyltransferase